MQGGVGNEKVPHLGEGLLTENTIPNHITVRAFAHVLLKVSSNLWRITLFFYIVVRIMQ